MDAQERLKKAKIVAIDMDNTLCKGDCYTHEECLLAEPSWDVIARLNELSKEKFVVVYTARRFHLAEATLLWLNRHNVMYHAISFKKTNTDVYIDDRMISIKDFLSEDEPYP